MSRKMNLRVCAIAILVATAVTSLTGAPTAKLLNEFSLSDMKSTDQWGLPEGFDISPDGMRIAIAFETVTNHVGGISVATLDIHNRQLLRRAVIDAPLTAAERGNPWAGR